MTQWKIVTHPQGWCSVCLKSWTVDMIAVQPRKSAPEVCGVCIEAAAQAVEDEQARRDNDRIAQRGG